MILQIIIFGALCGFFAHLMNKQLPLVNLLGAMVVGMSGAFIGYLFGNMFFGQGLLVKPFLIASAFAFACGLLYLRKLVYRI
jgi:uncharacterized membrane protein YeaQ/YmgE (transglycosylase-associated protein family)